MENQNTTGQITKVKFKKIWGIIQIVIAVLLLFGSFGLLGELVVIGFLVSGIIILIGQKAFSHDKLNKEITILAVLSPTSRTLKYDKIYIHGNRVTIEKDGKMRKIGIARFMYDKKDYDKFLKELS